MSDDLVFHVLNLTLFLVASGFLLTARVFNSPAFARKSAKRGPKRSPRSVF